MPRGSKLIFSILEKLELAGNEQGWVDISHDDGPVSRNDVTDKQLFIMRDEELIELVNEFGGEGSERVKILPSGHSFLESFRSNTWIRKFGRTIVRWLDKAMTSIFIPILVAIMTVVLINYFGIERSSESQ